MKIFKILYSNNQIGGLDKFIDVNEDKQIFDKNNYEYTYGELTNDGIKQLLKSIDTKNKIFYDLGSGNGNVVINAITNFPELKKSIGIELSKIRYNNSLNKLSEKKISNIEFINNDLLSQEINLNNADIIYISNLCFSENFNIKIAHKLDKELKSGTHIFSSKPLPLTIKHTHYKTTAIQTWSDIGQMNHYKLL